MKRSYFLCTAAALCAAAGLFAADWKIKDGTGSTVLKDSSPDKIDLAIATPDTVTWAREDDRSFFLNFAGGSVTGPAEKLLFPDGMILEADFSPDLKTGKEWLPLVTCGDTFNSGYSVWVRKNGTILICFPGTTGKWYMPVKAGLKNLVDYNLRIVRGENRCVVLLDGKVIADYVSKGEVKHTPGQPFRLGSTPKWKFYGNIYGVKISPFRKGAFKFEKKAEKKLTGAEITEIPGIEDPAGTVVVTDFSKFTPVPTMGRNWWAGRWMFRKNRMFPPPAQGVLHCSDNPDADSISYDPGLKGRYDVYLGLRAVYSETDMMIALKPALPEKLRVRILPIEVSHGRHTNTEVLIARNVKMDSSKIELFPGGYMYLGYIKFIPSSNRRKRDYPKWKCVTVSPEKRTYRELWDGRIRGLIAKRYLVERKYVDDKKVPAAGETAQKLGVIVNAHDWMDLLFESAVPAKAPEKVSLAVAAAPGEFEPACLAVYGLRDGKVALSGGKELAGAGITSEICVVRSLPKRTTNIYGPSEFIYGPQYLERTAETEVKKGVSKLFWITFKVGDNVKPGVYKGSFKLAAPGGDMTVPVTVTVRPFRLDPVLRETIAIAGDTYEYTPDRPDMLADHGCNGLGFNIDRDFRRTADGVDMEHSLAAKIVEKMKKRGLNMIRINLYGLTADCFRKGKGNAALFRKSLQDIMAYAAKHDWPQTYFYTADEVLSNPFNLKAAQWEMENIKAVGGKIMSSHIWYKTTRKFQKEAAALSEKIDLFHNRFSTRKLWYVDSWEEMMERCKKEGKKLSSYNIDNAILFAQPAMKRFSSGWFFRTLGKDAHQQWHFHWYKINRSPYTDLDGTGEAVDWCFNYPAGKGHKGGFCIDFEGVREGVDDLRYITTLENRIASAEKKGFTKEAAAARKVLEDLKKSFKHGEAFRKQSVFLDSKFEKAWQTENGDRFCSGRYNLPNGWSFEDYHNAREKIADEIIKLDKVLK